MTVWIMFTFSLCSIGARDNVVVVAAVVVGVGVVVAVVVVGVVVVDVVVVGSVVVAVVVVEASTGDAGSSLALFSMLTK